MLYYSLRDNSRKVGFEQAVVEGLAPDGGLYFPEKIPVLPPDFFERIGQMSRVDLAFEVIRPFVEGAIPDTALREILERTLTFDFPLVQLGDPIYALELFHGPTLAFKDVGARFMAGCLGWFHRRRSTPVTVLVATSGDTGSAVAQGFYQTPGVEVVILYPSGKVSALQELQLTTLGHNVRALEVQGVFDDCQAWVKRAFNDPDLKDLSLTSANSINVARWLPQMFYYFAAYAALKDRGEDITVSCPSGNFGNICAGLLAKKMGLPIRHFIAAQNANDTVHRYLESGAYQPKPTVPTLSNAMDVSAPSNWSRIRALYGNDDEALKKDLSTASFNDDDTVRILQKIYERFGYVADPHGALGYEALKRYLREHDGIGFFLETAHPVKFAPAIESALGIELEIPESVQDLLGKQKKSVVICDYEGLKRVLQER